ncbi:hypothetical protein NEUTE1DRAFT_97547 [Neurospora tetrasperma FGSC 2508]|uniref:Uncharacterized protein n=1 Tax=Neurospora tetrasperma (strain FGSC 2508 / ATCC MYA-4615 / P0657) TaxID=510951 RepID=F8MC22_NEUT8|nr:uncharacterized protein NEUTE1DRAFT_97547 [Neurospora tetrasperma FGSC 2508]EGO60376.1 hypothetical protein NEUTE1DRAFT_97547 [Neurospora tetrasperma FGSC 2508]
MARFMRLKCQGPLTRYLKKRTPSAMGAPLRSFWIFESRCVHAALWQAPEASFCGGTSLAGWLPDRRHKLNWKSVRVGGGVH